VEETGYLWMERWAEPGGDVPWADFERDSGEPSNHISPGRENSSRNTAAQYMVTGDTQWSLEVFNSCYLVHHFF
jgi:hypothetical protein